MKPFSLFILSAVTVALSACGGTPTDPIADAIGRDIRQKTRQPVHVISATKVDSTTIDVELVMRKGIYETRIRQNELRHKKFVREHKPKNAREMDETIEKDRKILAGLDSIRKVLGKGVSKVAYYHYEFECTSPDEHGHKLPPKTAYALVTPRLEVLAWGPEDKGLQKGTGVSIPGYRKLLENLKEPEK